MHKIASPGFASSRGKVLGNSRFYPKSNFIIYGSIFSCRDQIKKKLFTGRLGRPWHGWSQKSVSAPSVEASKAMCWMCLGQWQNGTGWALKSFHPHSFRDFGPETSEALKNLNNSGWNTNIQRKQSCIPAFLSSFCHISARGHLQQQPGHGKTPHSASGSAPRATQPWTRCCATEQIFSPAGLFDNKQKPVGKSCSDFLQGQARAAWLPGNS